MVSPDNNSDWQIKPETYQKNWAPANTHGHVKTREIALFPHESDVFMLFDNMTDRQKSIIVGFGLGYDVGKIATECNIDTSTVYTYRKRFMSTLKSLSGPQFIIICALWVRAKAFLQSKTMNTTTG